MLIKRNKEMITMPITENGSIEYAIPTCIRAMLTPELSAQFLKELHIIFGASVEDTDMDYFVYQGGTAGWKSLSFEASQEVTKDGLF
jgi:hypothetical protein